MADQGAHGVALYLLGHVAFRVRLVGEVGYEKLAVAATLLLLYTLGTGLPAWGTTAIVLPKTRHKTHLDGFPATVRIVRARHPLEGRSLELIGWMRRRRRLELLVVLEDGSRTLIPAVWTDLEGPARPPEAGALGSLDELLAARRVLDGVLRAAGLGDAGDGRAAVRAGRDDRAEELSDAAASGSSRVSGAGGGVGALLPTRICISSIGVISMTGAFVGGWYTKVESGTF